MRKSILGLCWVLVPCVAAVTACGSHRGAGRDRDADGGSDDVAPITLPAPSSAPNDSAGPTRAAPSDPDVADARPAPPSCVPEAGTDEPDDDFVDSNCDGIDGDVTHAVFVAPSGSDTASGTMAAPVQTLGKAVAVAGAAGKDVYACNGQYAENVVVDRTAVSIYGGYDCSNGWRRVVDRAVVVPAKGVPITVTAVATAVTFDRVAFRAPGTSAPGGSSIAAVVRDSTNVRFARAELRAGDAGNGTVAPPADDPRWPTQPVGADGSSAAGATDCSASGTTLYSGGPTCLNLFAGGQGYLSLCPDGKVIRGGTGGTGANFGLQQIASLGGTGQPTWSLSLDGPKGSSGASGAAGGRGFGQFVNGAYVPENGTDGTAGADGYSGSGGTGGSSVGTGDVAVFYAVGGGGGQGGYAGCGGSPGKGGGGGGASIALAADRSTIALSWCDVITGRGGEGGAPSLGLAGQAGTAGGKGGAGGSTYGGGNHGQNGGKGGDGGDGGNGGPGAGGPSIGIASIGAEPAADNVTFVLGAAGRGASSPGATAADGVEAETYSIDGRDAGQ